MVSYKKKCFALFKDMCLKYLQVELVAALVQGHIPLLWMDPLLL